MAGTTSLVTWAPLQSGTLINGNYEVIGKIGEGSCSIVYQVRDMKTKKEYAMKEFGLDASDNDYSVQHARFQEEQKVLDAVKGRNIPGMHDAFDYAAGPAGTKNHSYFVMDFVQGTCLEDILMPKIVSGKIVPGKRFDDAEALRIGRQVMDILSRVHKKGYVHCDVKPSSIIVDGTEISLIDFNSAIPKGTTTDYGSEPFAAPEQYLAKNKQPVDATTDFYGLGMTLDAMLDPDKYYSNSPAGTRVLPLQTPLNQGSDLNLLIQRLTQQDPALRYQNAGEAMKEFKSLSKAINSKAARQKIKSIPSGICSYIANNWVRTKQNLVNGCNAAIPLIAIAALVYGVHVPFGNSRKWYEFQTTMASITEHQENKSTIHDGLYIKNTYKYFDGTRESYPFHLFTTQMTGDGKNYFLIKEKKYAKIPLSRYSAYFLSFSAEQHITKAEKETSLMDLQTVLSPDDPDITAVKAWIKKTYPEGNVTFGAVKFDGNLRKLYNKSKEGLMEEYKDRAPENTEGIIKRWKRTK